MRTAEEDESAQTFRAKLHRGLAIRRSSARSAANDDARVRALVSVKGGQQVSSRDEASSSSVSRQSG
jgi:hypothetical protein